MKLMSNPSRVAVRPAARRTRLVTVVMCGALALAGCGDEGGSIERVRQPDAQERTETTASPDETAADAVDETEGDAGEPGSFDDPAGDDSSTTTSIPAVQRPKYDPDTVLTARATVEPRSWTMWAEAGLGPIEFVDGTCYLNAEGLVVEFGVNDYESDYFGLYAPFGSDGTFEIAEVGVEGGVSVLKNAPNTNFTDSAPDDLDGPMTLVLENGRTRGSGATGTMTRDDLGFEFTFECT